MKEIVWNSPENNSATKVLAQHAFISTKINFMDIEEYEGNKSLCGKIGIANETERLIPIPEIVKEQFDKDKACKRCISIASKMLNKKAIF